MRALNKRSSVVLSVWVGLCLSIVGCGGGDSGTIPETAGPKGTVKGKVTVEGKPVKGGSIFFHSGKGVPLTGEISTAGEFELQGPNGKNVPSGQYKVSLGLPPPVVEMTPDKPSVPAMKSDIPVKFLDPSSSGVTHEIKAGANDLTIDFK
ncbi:MAG: hypothetical protein ACKV2Q_07835 [Planctomycetaceae bacterium]